VPGAKQSTGIWKISIPGVTWCTGTWYTRPAIVTTTSLTAPPSMEFLITTSRFSTLQ